MVHAWQFGLVGILAVAMVTDLQTRKIYNWLTFPAMAVGLALSVAFGGLGGLQASLIGFFAGSLVFALGFFMGGAMGAGDVKLMAAIGLWLGWPNVVASVLYVTLCGGLVAILSATYHGTLLKLLKNLYWAMMGLAMPGGKAAVAAHESAAPPMPYGISIGLGTLLALFYPEPIALLQVFQGGPH
ncbi:MAG: peptidase prepilin type [Cyanobacteria bacterium RYN_339]|nr:peptidase prepilin type [Cyanobacteria bacterium RYN_339]